MANPNHGQTGEADIPDLLDAAADGFEDFFSTPARQGLIQQLLHLIRFGDGIPVVQGAGRSGKSAIAKHLVSELSEVPHLALVDVRPDARLLDILVEALRQYGLGISENASEGELLAELRRFAQALNGEQKLGVLVLDNAHLLDDQSLGALVSLLQGTDSPGYGLHLVFFAQPDLVSRIDDLGLLEISVYDFDVPLMSPSELADFLKNFLEGRQDGSRKLSAETIQTIWSRSRGAPGYSLRLMFETMRSAPPSPKSRLANIPAGHVVALSVLLGVLVWALLVRDADVESERKVSEVSVPETVAARGQEVIQESARQPEIAPDFRPDLKETSMAGTDGTSKQQKSVEAGQDQPAPPPDSAITVDSPAAVENMSDIDGKPVPQSRLGAQATVSSPAPLPSPKVASVPKVAPAPKVTLAPEVSLAKSTTWQGDRFTPDEKFLLDQSPASYTLQIMAAGKKEALENFVAGQANSDALFLYRGMRGGKSWYILVAGIYPSRAAAAEAIAKLPAGQKKGGPWPRQLESIQREIKENSNK